jgi:hypothetical protein
MEVAQTKTLAEFGIENILDQIRKLSAQIDMDCADIIIVLQFAEKGANIRQAYMAIKSINNPIAKAQLAFVLDKNDYFDLSQELKDLDASKSPKKKPKRENQLLEADKPLDASNLVAFLNELAKNKSYSMIDDDNSINMIKHLTLSAGIHDRITKGKQGCNLEILSRIKAEIAHRKAAPSDSELKCLQELNKIYPGYALNSKLYFNAFVNGTPDAVLLGPSGDVIRCAEFKYTNTSDVRQQKSNGFNQLNLYLSIFRIPHGDLIIQNSAGSFFHFEVEESKIKAKEKVDLFLNFRDYIIKSSDPSVSHIKDLRNLAKFEPCIDIHSDAEVLNKRQSQSA